MRIDQTIAGRPNLQSNSSGEVQLDAKQLSEMLQALVGGNLAQVFPGLQVQNRPQAPAAPKPQPQVASVDEGSSAKVFESFLSDFEDLVNDYLERVASLNHKRVGAGNFTFIQFAPVSYMNANPEIKNEFVDIMRVKAI